MSIKRKHSTPSESHNSHALPSTTTLQYVGPKAMHPLTALVDSPWVQVLLVSFVFFTTVGMFQASELFSVNCDAIIECG